MKPRTTGGPARYSVPRYRAAGEPAYYHVLHGTVPGHQIDFIYCPEVPQGPLNRTHLAHVARLVKHIEPRERASLAFAIGNLSRDDVQHEPGHGGLVLLAGLRVEGVVDHASRALPPFAHGLVAIDRAFDRRSLVATALAFCERLRDEDGDAAGAFYREYTRRMRERPHTVESLLAEHVGRFADLPEPGPSALGADFLARPDAPPPERVTIVHANDTSFAAMVGVAAAIGSVLYRSDIKWTAISSGRELGIPGGTSIRFVPESEALRDPRGLVIAMDSIPPDDAGIADVLFSAAPRRASSGARTGWRAQLAERVAAAGREPERPDVSAATEERSGAAETDGERGPSISRSQRPGARWWWIAGSGGAALLAAVLLLWRTPASPPTPDFGGEAATAPPTPQVSPRSPPPRESAPSSSDRTPPDTPAPSTPSVSKGLPGVSSPPARTVPARAAPRRPPPAATAPRKDAPKGPAPASATTEAKSGGDEPGSPRSSIFEERRYEERGVDVPR